MTDDDDLRLNTLHRFSKHSQKLVLEEHGHCEVPAGCGGVILTWRNPAVALPIVLYVASPGRCQVYVDGTLARSGRLELPFGPRVLMFHLADMTEAPRMFAAVACIDPGPGQAADQALPDSQTSGDGSWRVSTTAPAEAAFTDPDFDDRGWHALQHVPMPDELPEGDQWAYDNTSERGASTLQLPTATESWVRKRLLLSPALAGTRQP